MTPAELILAKGMAAELSEAEEPAEVAEPLELNDTDENQCLNTITMVLTMLLKCWNHSRIQ